MGLQDAIDGASPSILLAQSGAAVSHTGDTNETVLATVPVPAGLMGANGLIAVRSTWLKTGTAGTLTNIVRFGLAGAGLGGTSLYMPASALGATTLSSIVLVEIKNANSVSSQLGSITSAQGIGSSGAALPSATINTAAACEVVLSVQLGAAADTATLAFYQVMIYPHA